MKKLLITLVIVLGLSFMGCDSETNTTTTTTTLPEVNALEQAFSDYSTTENVTVVMTMTNVPFFGTMVTTVKIDGDMFYVSIGGIEQYFKVVDGQVYEYTQEESGWTLSSEPVEGDVTETVDVDLFDFNDFSEVEGIWVTEIEHYYPEGSITDYLENIEFILDEDGNLASMVYDMSNGEYTMGVSAVFSDYGTTVVELPEIE